MKTIISRFTFGKSKQLVRPAIWLFLENFFMLFPAIAIYIAINALAAAFTAPETIDLRALWITSGILLGLLVIQYFIGWGTYLNTFVPTAKHSAENKTGFVKKLRRLPLGFFSNKESGELINSFSTDFIALEQAMTGYLSGLFGIALGCVLGAVFLFIFNPAMALALYISLPVTLLVMVLAMKKMAAHAAKIISTKDRAATSLNEYLLGMKMLKSYNQTGNGFGKLDRAYHDLMEANTKAESVSGSFLRLCASLIRLGLPLMCLSGAYLMLGGKLGIVEYLSLIIIGTKMLSPLISGVQNVLVLRTNYLSAKRLSAVMEEKETAGTDKAITTGDIRFDHVDFAYREDGEAVLKDVSFAIPEGKLTAIVGPSGSGKTTVLRLIARFWDAQKGDIRCGGKRLTELDADAWLDSISMVLQDVYLFRESIRDNILFGRKVATEAEMMDAARRAGCHDFIMAMPDGYDTIVGEGGSTLSGGEKQRISIARAILKNAPILLLDEPTASLDARNEVLIQRAIGELVRGRTVVMIAHRLKTVQNAHQIIVLEGGEIKEYGTHAALIEQKGLYAHLWTMQNQAQGWNLRKQVKSVAEGATP